MSSFPAGYQVEKGTVPGTVAVSSPFTLAVTASDMNLIPVSCQLLYSVVAGSSESRICLPWTHPMA